MKKKLMARCLVGAPIGLALSTLITIVISLTVGDGRFYPVVPELIDLCKTEINAVALQAVCSLLYGAAWGGASLVWETEKWSLLRQTVTHLIVCSVFTFPIAYFMWWMKHTPSGIALYFGAFLGVYLLIWSAEYLVMKRRVQKLNERMKRRNAES